MSATIRDGLVSVFVDQPGQILNIAHAGSLGGRRLDRPRNCVVVVRPQRILDNEADLINCGGTSAG